jgi:type 1 glutamine amidotransferase
MGATDERTAIVVVSGDDVYEDLFTASQALQNILTAGGYVTSVGMGLNRIVDDSPIAADLVVLYTAMGRFAPTQQEALAEAVSAGLGLITIHSSAVLGIGEDYRAAFDLFGARYASHGPVPHESRFMVHLVSDHPITAGLADFAIDHEHYRLEVVPAADVLAWRDAPYGIEPLLTVSRLGAGRVCYLQLGHDMRVWDEPTVRAIIGRAADWARRDARAA